MRITSVGASGLAGFDLAREGMRQSEIRLNRAAERIAGGELGAAPMVDLIVSERMYNANANVIRTQDRMLGTLLDVVR